MKASLLSAIIVLAVAGFFGYKIISEHQSEAQRLREQLQQESELGNRQAQLEESLGLVELYRRRLAPGQDVVWLLRTVGELANEADIHLSAISPQPPKHRGDFTQVSVSLRLTASYHQLGRFLSRLESAEHLLRVDKLNLASKASGDGPSEAEVELVVSTMYLPPLRL